MSYTFAMIKSPTIGRGQESDVLKEITRKGFHIVGYTKRNLCETTIKAFYQAHVSAPYFSDLAQSVDKGVVALLLVHPEGNTITRWREAIGATKSITAAEGTIRAMFGGHNWRGESCPIADNVVHGSDSAAAASYEASLVFEPAYLATVMSAARTVGE